MDKVRRAILVVGAPRSGTSVVAHVLNKLGVDFGSPERFIDPEQHTYNPIFYELMSLNVLNDEIFAHFSKRFSEANWLPTIEVFSDEVVAKFEPGISALITREFGSASPTIGFKDPRFCFTLPLWVKVLKSLGFHVDLVLTQRSFDQIFRSNIEFNALSEEANYRLIVYSHLASRYMLDEKQYVELLYEELLDAPSQTIKRLAENLGLSCDNLPDAEGVVLVPERRPAREEGESDRFESLIHSGLNNDFSRTYRFISDLAECSHHEGNKSLLSYMRGEQEGKQRSEELQRELAELNSKFVEVNQQMSEISRQLEGVLRSRSWKITWPLRFLFKLFN